MTDYIEIKINCEKDFSEILQAELGEIGFNSFVDTDNGFDAYVLESDFDQSSFQELIARYLDLAKITYESKTMERVNWNEEWEKNYDPIIVDDQCIVKASFHQTASYPYEIIIDPKMSFGTGHHETTYLMLKDLLSLDLKGKKVLDAGCGTGILAIMAHKKGAAEIKAYDIDPWCEENSRKNFVENNSESIEVQTGTISSLNYKDNFDVILANINKNVLLEDIPAFSKLLKDGGLLLLSGFYENDIADLDSKTSENGLQRLHFSTKNNWALVRYTKS